MAFSEVLIGFVISCIANNIPTIRELFGNRKSLGEKIEGCYKDALKKRYGIDEWHMDLMPYHFRSLRSFGFHLASSEVYDNETLTLLEAFETELKGNPDCYQFIIDLKIDSMATELSEIKKMIQKNNKSFSEMSSALKAVERTFLGKKHVKRDQTDHLYHWVCSDLSNLKSSRRIAALLGDPGTGKTVILADLVDKLEEAGIPVIGLKSDLLFDSTTTDIDKAVNIGGKTLLEALAEKASEGITVLVIDQMDALSLSLTTQRKPLAEVRRVIYDASLNPNIRVVFSCRKYDWENDLQLTAYDGANIVSVERLETETVTQVLAEEGVEIRSLSSKTIDIIHTPVYLSFFLRVRNEAQALGLSTITELLKLYWEKTLLTEALRHGYKTDDLVALLRNLSAGMVQNQLLVSPIATIPTARLNDLHFLISNGFLTLDATKTKVQFSHQTLFDYTYSRLFCENGNSLVSLLSNSHQGIFLRNTIRRVLEYQRLANEDEYIGNIKAILSVKNCGINVRFHLKQLVLTVLGAQETLLEKEGDVLRKEVFSNSEFLRTFARTVYAEGSTGLLLEHVQQQGGLSKCDTVVSDRIIQLLPNYIYTRNFTFATRIVSQCKVDYPALSDHTKDVLFRCIQGFSIGENTINEVEVAQFVLDTVRVFDTDKEQFPFSFIYRSLVNYFPNEVVVRLREYIQARLALWDKTESYTLLVNNDVDYVIEALREKNPQLFLNAGLEILNDILEDSISEHEVADIKASTLFFVYNRSNRYHSFPESFLDGLLQVMERAVDEKWDNVSELIKLKSKSNFVVNHVVAITGWLKDIATYKDDAVDYLVENVKKVFHSSSLTYYQVRLFGSVFPLCGGEMQSKLVQQILQLLPDWEKKPFGRNGVGKHPETYYGHARAQFFKQVDEDLLRSVSEEAWTALQVAKRRNLPLDNHEPNQISVMEGWRTFTRSEFEKMSVANLVDVAKKYDKNDYINFETPTMTGNAIAMRDMVADYPEKMYEAYRQMIGVAKLGYVTMGLESLLEAETSDEKMLELYTALFNEIGDDVNSETVSTSVLMDISRCLSYYADHRRQVPQILMDFVQKIASDYNDNDDPDNDDVDHNTGINRVRGCAAYALVDCLYMDGYRDSIVATLSGMADNASVATRSAALFKLGILARFNPDALQTLFLKLTHDYNKNLLRLPAHVQNPLHYLVHYRFDALVPYFEHCIAEVTSHRVNVVWLWMATSLNHDGAKELLYKMADASIDGSSALVQYVARFHYADSLAKEIDVYQRYMSQDDEILGSTFDTLFIDMKVDRARAMNDFFEDFFVSAACKYCRHYVYGFLKSYCDYDADSVLLWLTMLYESKKKGQIEYDELTNVLLLAYNRILNTDKENKMLEDAMDLLDDVLRLDSNYMVSHLTYKLNYE